MTRGLLAYSIVSHIYITITASSNSSIITYINVLSPMKRHARKVKTQSARLVNSYALFFALFFALAFVFGAVAFFGASLVAALMPVITSANVARE